MTQEIDHADGNTCGQVLPKVEGQAREGECGGDMPVFNRTIPENRKSAKVKKGPQKLMARKTPGYKQQIEAMELNGADLAVLAPRRMNKGDRTPIARFEQAWMDRIKLYQEDGLDALHDLAMMPISENSMQNNIKFAAAKVLAGNAVEDHQTPTGMDKTLEALNSAFHSASSRIKSVRERIVEFESTPKLIEGTTE